MTHSLGAVVVDGEHVDQFEHVKPDVEQQARYKKVRDAARALRSAIYDAVPKGDPRHNALIRLQESVMWSNWGISRDRKPEVAATAPAPDAASFKNHDYCYQRTFECRSPECLKQSLTITKSSPHEDVPAPACPECGGETFACGEVKRVPL